LRIASCTFSLVLAFTLPIASAQTATQTVTPPTKHRARTAAASSRLVAAPAAAPAAVPAPCTPPPVLHTQPYTLKLETTRVQTLAGGTTITTVEEIVTARDADGRTYRDTTHTFNGDVTHLLSIYDYPTQTRYTWSIGPNYPKVVTVYRPRPMQQPTPPQPARRYYPYRTESLPPQTIAGLYANGSRSTRTVPASYEGNDRDLVTTTENWDSPELGLMLRSVTDDPRSGKSTTEATDFQRTADPALFQPPAGFQLKDATP